MYEYFWFFMIYSFIGWCAEVAFAALKRGVFVNRGFLNGPYCPIYGVGVVLVVGLLTPLQDNLLILYVGSVVVCSVVELVTGFLLEKLFHQRWWDYSDIPFNIGGYICPLASLGWGFACILILKVIHPLIAGLVSHLGGLLGNILLVFFTISLIVDLIATVKSILKLNQQLQQIDELAARIKHTSNELGENIAEGVINITAKTVEYREELAERRTERQEERLQRQEERAERWAELREDVENWGETQVERFTEWKEEQAEKWAEWQAAGNLKNQRRREELEQLLEERRQAIAKSFFGKKRLLDAFPNLRSTKHEDALQEVQEERKQAQEDKRAERRGRQEEKPGA